MLFFAFVGFSAQAEQFTALEVLVAELSQQEFLCCQHLYRLLLASAWRLVPEQFLMCLHELGVCFSKGHPDASLAMYRLSPSDLSLFSVKREMDTWPTIVDASLGCVDTVSLKSLPGQSVLLKFSGSSCWASSPIVIFRV